MYSGKEEGPEFYDQIVQRHQIYKAHYTEYRKWYPLFLVIMDRLRNTCRSKRILDLGCGAGHLAQLLFDQGFKQYLGLDFSTEMLKAAEARCLPYTFQWMDLNVPGWGENYGYDVVVATEFLEHIKEDINIIKQIKSGTRCLFTTTNEPGKGHVRIFPTAQSVELRYADLFYNLDVLTIRNALTTFGWQVFYILDGVKR